MSLLPLLPDVDPEIIYTNAWFHPDTHQPAVYWQLGEKNGVISLTETRARAQAIFQAVGYAEAEAAIVKGMLQLNNEAYKQSKPKAFGKQSESEMQKALAMTAQLREYVRKGRAPLLEGIEVIYGLKTQRALINVTWYGSFAQWEISQALEHAIGLIETAEAAESDAYFRWFLMEKLEIEAEEAYPMIAEFQIFRQRRQLEDLFQGDADRA